MAATPIVEVTEGPVMLCAVTLLKNTADSKVIYISGHSKYYSVSYGYTNSDFELYFWAEEGTLHLSDKPGITTVKIHFPDIDYSSHKSIQWLHALDYGKYDTIIHLNRVTTNHKYTQGLWYEDYEPNTTE